MNIGIHAPKRGGRVGKPDGKLGRKGEGLFESPKVVKIAAVMLPPSRQDQGQEDEGSRGGGS